MFYQEQNEVEDFFGFHRFPGRNESTKHITGKQRHRKEKQWLPAYILRQKGKIKINIQHSSEMVLV